MLALHQMGFDAVILLASLSVISPIYLAWSAASALAISGILDVAWHRAGGDIPASRTALGLAQRPTRRVLTSTPTTGKVPHGSF